MLKFYIEPQFNRYWNIEWDELWKITIPPLCLTTMQQCRKHRYPHHPRNRDELAEQKKRYEELNDRYLRLAADFDNYRKRTARDHEAMVQHANECFAVDILEIADNLERALKS